MNKIGPALLQVKTIEKKMGKTGTALKGVKTIEKNGRKRPYQK